MYFIIFACWIGRLNAEDTYDPYVDPYVELLDQHFSGEEDFDNAGSIEEIPIYLPQDYDEESSSYDYLGTEIDRFARDYMPEISGNMVI